MNLIGRIEPDPGVHLDRDAWVTLIEQHPQLARIAPREGVNPFTRKPILLEAPTTSARVCVAGAEIGTITWADDGSELLNVWASSDLHSQLIEIANKVAGLLQCRFIQQS